MNEVGFDRLRRGPGAKPRRKMYYVEKQRITANMEDAEKNFVRIWNEMIDVLQANGDMEPKTK